MLNSENNNLLNNKMILCFILFATAFIFRIIHLLQLSEQDWYFKILLSDSYVFVKNAFEIINGQFLGHRVFYQDPLYIIFLSGIFILNGGVLFDIAIVQIILSSFTAVIIFLTAGRLYNKKAGLMAGLLFSVYPLSIYYDSLILKPSLILFFLALYLFSLTFKYQRFSNILSSIFLSLLCLMRGNFLIWIPFHLIWIYKFNLKFKEVSLSLITILFLILPCTYMNYLASNDFILITSQAGQNFYTGNNPYNKTGYYIPLPFVRPSALHEEKDFHTEAEKRNGKKMLPSEVSKFWFKESCHYIFNHPLTSLLIWGKRALIFFDQYEVPDNYDYQAVKKLTYIKCLSFINFPLILSLAFLGYFFSPKRPLEKYMGLIILLYFLSLVLFFIYGRYRVPLTVPLILFAGNALGVFYEKAATDKKRLAYYLVTLLLMVSLFSWNPIRLKVDPEMMNSYILKRAQ